MCPQGGYCPGGNRIWPLPGWYGIASRRTGEVTHERLTGRACMDRWVTDEFAGTVAPCYPPERCLGGRFANCREGHTGAYCSLCEEGWYMKNDLCQQCEAPSYIAFLFFVQFAFLAMYLLVMFVAPEEVVQNVEFILQNLRYVRVAGKGKESDKALCSQRASTWESTEWCGWWAPRRPREYPTRWTRCFRCSSCLSATCRSSIRPALVCAPKSMCLPSTWRVRFRYWYTDQ